MRMPVMFKRFLGGPTPALGSDGAAGVPPTASPNPQAQDNVLSTKFYSNQGWPTHRIAVGYLGPAAAPTLPAQLWVYDFKSAAWYAVGAPLNLVVNQMNYFDVVALLDAPPTSSDQNTTTAGGVEAMLVVQNNAGPNGTYTFTMGADLTTLPI